MAGLVLRPLLRVGRGVRRSPLPALIRPTRGLHLGWPRLSSEVSVTFETPEGRRFTVQAPIGQNLLDVVIDNEVDIDGFGACEGTLACSTCHLVFKPEDFERIQEEITDEEMDMLDLAYGLTDTSRLGCQVCLTKEMDGLEVRVPEGINDQR